MKINLFSRTRRGEFDRRLLRWQQELLCIRPQFHDSSLCPVTRHMKPSLCSAVIPQKLVYFSHRHSLFFTLPFTTISSLSTHTSHYRLMIGRLLQYIPKLFLLLLNTLPITTSQHFIFSMQSFLIYLTHLQHTSFTLHPPETPAFTYKFQSNLHQKNGQTFLLIPSDSYKMVRQLNFGYFNSCPFLYALVGELKFIYFVYQNKGLKLQVQNCNCFSAQLATSVTCNITINGCL